MAANHCCYCGKTIPEGRMICWACEYKYSGLHPNCVHFHGSSWCILKCSDCTPLPCKWFEKKVKEEDIDE